MNLTDTELALSIELRQTRLALAQQQSRAAQNEAQLAQLMGADAQRELKDFFVEQERRDAEKKAPPAAPVATPE